MLTQTLTAYYKQVLELSAIYSSPQTPPLVKEVTSKILKAASESVDKMIRTFDSVRNPETFTIDFEQAIAEAEQGAPQGGLAGLSQILQGLMPQNGQVPEPAIQ
jgi:hypothetical protein